MKTGEDLKKLRHEDFIAPNKVLCYGGGGAFHGVAPYMMKCGMNLVGVLDANKSGSVEICGKKLPYFSISRGMELFGKYAKIVITIANEKVIQQVEQTLVQHGFQRNNIFDLNVWTWLTTSSEKSCCGYIGGYLQFTQPALSKCCNTGIVDAYLCEWFVEGRPLEQSVSNFLEKRKYYMEEMKQGRISLYCQNCSYLSEYRQGVDNNLINQFIISDHALCNADCIYCGDACSVPKKYIGATVEERYETIIKTLERLQNEDIIHKHAVFQIAGGEITINPYKKKLYDAVRKVPEMEIQFLSNCFLYDSDIADILSQNRNAFLQCDLDAGTPETYIKVKGFNKFQIVKENLKKYAQHGRVKIKYVILPGWNDTIADYEGTVALLQDLGIRELQLSPEFNAAREEDRMAIRQVLFASANFMNLLGKNGIETILPEPFWKKDYVVLLKRLYRELRELQNQGGEE